MANMKKVKKYWMEVNKDWIKQNKSDKIKVNLAYTMYLDGLCKDGIITLNQWHNADTTIIK
jgi:hypothetical protein